ncbi:hypothetical protein GCM10011514_55060 [Emticicia aquatilis]|uniref:Uncharacterized protein n=1 Tax=Emticicia aquatilis TaxID=1537369 RepID=A0A917E0C7_9BACT|nr:hypothetical protein [Emticicia aquatilis]GGD84058.1 hypothetical protein GCM10011514_55060 [Emticicia aquatilis]
MRKALFIFLFILPVTSLFAQQNPEETNCSQTSIQRFSLKENGISKRKKRTNNKSKTIMTNFAEHNFRVFTC